MTTKAYKSGQKPTFRRRWAFVGFCRLLSAFLGIRMGFRRLFRPGIRDTPAVSNSAPRALSRLAPIEIDEQKRGAGSMGAIILDRKLSSLPSR